MAKIAASWVISPLLGGVIAVIFLAFIKINIIYQDDKIAAAKRWVPVLIAIMVSVFSGYLAMKGLKRVWHPDYFTIAVSCTAVFIVALLVLRPLIARQAEGLENRNQSLRKLFHWPLIFSAALLSFAHGSNDVAMRSGLWRPFCTAFLQERLRPKWAFRSGLCSSARSGLPPACFYMAQG